VAAVAPRGEDVGVEIEGIDREAGHPWIRSYEPGEDWFYNFDDGQTYDGPELAPPGPHPVDQAMPGPQGRVPADWQQRLN
jgi:hypothetical protein